MGYWKKVFKSEHLSSSDVEGKDLVLVIEYVKQEMCNTQNGKEEANIAYFTDKSVKPMRLNVGNSKLVKKFSGNKLDTDDWKMIPVSIYVDPKVRWGSDTVEGLRIRPVQPKITQRGEVIKPALTPESPNWNDIVKWIQSGNKIEAVWAKYEVSEENKVKFKEAIEEVKE